MTKTTTDAEAKLPDPAAVLYPNTGFRQDVDAIATWRNFGYDTGGEPFYSADQLHSYASARVAAARLASTSPAPDGSAGCDYVPGRLDGEAPPRVWLQIDTSGDNNERDEPWPGADVVTWQDESIGGLEIQYVRADLAAPQPVVENENG